MLEPIPFNSNLICEMLRLEQEIREEIARNFLLSPLLRATRESCTAEEIRIKMELAEDPERRRLIREAATIGRAFYREGTAFVSKPKRLPSKLHPLVQLDEQLRKEVENDGSHRTANET